MRGRHSELLLSYRYDEEISRGVECAHRCEPCESANRSPSPNNMRCPSCGHTYHDCEIQQHCTLCDSNSFICPCCQTGCFGTGEYEEQWYCSHCWAEWESSTTQTDILVQVTAAEAFESLQANTSDLLLVSCFNALSGEKLLSTEVPREGGLRRLRETLRQQLVQYDPNPKRVAGNGFAYSETEFQTYYSSFGPGVYEQRWEEAPQVRTTNVQLLLGAAVVPESDDERTNLASSEHGELLVEQRLQVARQVQYRGVSAHMEEYLRGEISPYRELPKYNQSTFKRLICLFLGFCLKVLKECNWLMRFCLRKLIEILHRLLF